MSLPPLKFMLDSQLSRSEQDFKVALQLTNKKDKALRRHHLEGALSDAWQAYCTFVRYVLIRSATGTVTSAGVNLPATVAPPTWERVSHVGLRAAKQHNVQPGATNTLIWKEPTWGDSTKIVDIVNALSPVNGAILKAYFAGGWLVPNTARSSEMRALTEIRRQVPRCAIWLGNMLLSRSKIPPTHFYGKLPVLANILSYRG